ncbi:pirin family protein [Xylophilus rhododendri]|uniref:Pirin family protein n=1 Tax=Xylophilus rhododendri TaxID=2697032 RepID=A0A857JCY9_9BURK|nr:pirin family protein [Xylophilus rhododendri]QHJ00833.1 pirin family protein [Xylophilus rhododendri]
MSAASADHLTLVPKSHDLGGGFVVRRTLPAAAKRSVGPFIFFDHFGPAEERPEELHDVRPHPHIGLATVTYLFEGAIHHRDSIGSDQVIEPGAVNWMSAGRGIVHSERRPERLQHSIYTNHGLQLWAALPAALEESDPSFTHVAAAEIPALVRYGVAIRVLIGEVFGVKSPVPAAGGTVFLDIEMPVGGRLELPALAQELAVYPVAGSVTVDGEALPTASMSVLPPDSGALLEAAAPVRLVVVGGDALLEHRYLWWNFVSTRKERVRQAAQDWAAGAMGEVPGDIEFIPLPDRPLPA